MEPIDIIVLVIFFVVILGVGLYFSRNSGKSTAQFFLGGRNMPWYLAGISMVATTFAADTPLAVNELVYENGISGNWLWWNMLIGGMLTTFFFARLWRRSGVMTEAEFIELRYSGPEAAFLRGFKSIYLGVFMNVCIIGWVNLAMASILQEMFHLAPKDALTYTFVAMAFVGIYSSISGFLGVAITDAIQFVVAMTGCIVLAVLVIHSEQIGGISGLKEQINQTSPGALRFLPEIGKEKAGNVFALGFGSFFAYIGVQWWASWYPGAEPGGGGYVAQRMLSTKNEQNSIFATLFFQAAHYCLRPWPWILVALASLVLYPGLENHKIGYVMAMNDFLPAGMKGLMLAAFFAAYMSTISTQLNWGASYVVNDFYERFINRNSSAKNSVLVSRVATLVLMLIGMFVTTQINSISGVWKFIMECGAGLGLVLILRWYWWRINAWSEIIATIVPFVVYATLKFAYPLLNQEFGLHLPIYDFPVSFFITVGITTFAWLFTTFFIHNNDLGHLRAFYEKVKPMGVWKKFNPQLSNEKLIWLFASWISSVVFLYSLLFITGKFILQEWLSVAKLAVILCVSLILLVIFVKKSGAFSEKNF